MNKRLSRIEIFLILTKGLSHSSYQIFCSLYFPFNKTAIGVVKSKKPIGPWQEAVSEKITTIFDPTVFIDDDGQAYMLWGNPICYYVKLNEDMISYDGEVTSFPNTIKSFGKREGNPNPRRPTTYEEGPWLYKRNNLYYLFTLSKL